VLSTAEPTEVTYACADGKQMWTRDPAQVKWWLTDKEAEAAMLAAQEKCAAQSWFKGAGWVMSDETTAKAVLEALRAAATP